MSFSVISENFLLFWLGVQNPDLRFPGFCFFPCLLWKLNKDFPLKWSVWSPRRPIWQGNLAKKARNPCLKAYKARMCETKRQGKKNKETDQKTRKKNKEFLSVCTLAAKGWQKLTLRLCISIYKHCAHMEVFAHASWVFNLTCIVAACASVCPLAAKGWQKLTLRLCRPIYKHCAHMEVFAHASWVLSLTCIVAACASVCKN